MKHLVELGHARIGFLAPPQDVFDMGLGFAFRGWRGIADELAERQLDFHAIATEATREGVHSAIERFLDEVPGADRPDRVQRRGPRSDSPVLGAFRKRRAGRRLGGGDDA